ncbi:MAG TPA: tRNA (guanosine(37)-N1)-methyltransferase TrmD [Candidatus Cloacimonadota bacterium]|jgi:tRNA (guanine37-N1)-methyltransferase|nr:tRNA (guanosine(37)-N1)-methyltransferase TrmD [Candidatus Cloacimonadales bacterium]HPY97021.1 tRNA (guanosine(37)-N1)-methyltransferase TrmD [Candidatus Cloacimonadota bacterium]HQB41581.1 tRNA (guanosine(37)-N1)-methyltransferase TrmD [Candidatus Cloacimonadota bacterium]
MIINVLTLFPDCFSSFLSESIPKIAIEKEKLKVNFIDIRDFSGNKQRQVDDYPYGGGSGMVVKPEPLIDSIEFIQKGKKIPVIYFTPQGRLLNQQIVRQYLSEPEIILLCGHYKEIDQRVRDYFVTDELSIGDYVLSGGELPAMIMIDALARLQDGVLSDIDSALTDSHENGLLGHPHYTRPADLNGMQVPEVLLSGNHKKIDEWRQQKSLEITQQRRSDLLDK